ncbi:tellurium resistance protein TerC [Candidatus Roizmanbacteria bacterium RIFCSPHIGHO2_02_FULL_37_13b]|uniref:Tellurium resistance protein TerC n=1 Tax=Candidatus Roizmanbacteria bacterium RIFCSPLOWO2_02_FULL_36_11 TaxID=1802071 RepID=A0A1F7JGJ1_9BACT|nr:MAG: tellurium resistance protein TerC [Candidatus Roizmanbacteria bacterium RIFCSPHIGHO2_02_FULL_37_13b]OGK54725.1 MAG: tellurium resistance protein TerC [Candidatus Roizmanbacteria bacterium RIFCSPLOWO2_02_FULL_36_11]
MDIQQILFITFTVIIIGFLVVDLGIFNRRAHKVSSKSALIQSIFWVAISFGFAFLILLYLGREMAAQFMSAYVTEKLLSVDNLFVFMLIFSYFKLEEKYHHKVLFWGILGAIIFRALFITIGAYIIHQFYWVLYIFGAILIYTGIKLLWDKKEEHIDIKHHKIFKLAHKYLPFSTAPHNGNFLIRENGKLFFTILFMIVLLIETTDIVFAIDSIPAAFAITQNTFVIYTSNIFAIMGLRALFFLIENVLHKFHHLQKGLAFILIFIGLKMLLTIFGLHISSIMSFAIIMTALGVSLLLSILFPKEI